MRFSTLLLAGVATLAVGSTAFAADLIIDEPAAPIIDIPSSDWTGFYVGVHGGYGAGVMDLSAPGLIDPDDEEQDVDGFFGGIQAGYNWQMDSLLFGIQTDISLSGIASDEDGGGENDTIDWLGSTTGRIGFVNDAFVPYLKAGIAYAGGTGDAAGETDSQTHLAGPPAPASSSPSPRTSRCSVSTTITASAKRPTSSGVPATSRSPPTSTPSRPV